MFLPYLWFYIFYEKPKSKNLPEAENVAHVRDAVSNSALNHSQYVFLSKPVFNNTFMHPEIVDIDVDVRNGRVKIEF